MLSQVRMGAEQATQWEGGDTIDSWRGSRSATTPTNEPMARPTTPASASTAACIWARRSPDSRPARVRREQGDQLHGAFLLPRLSWSDACRTLSKVVRTRRARMPTAERGSASRPPREERRACRLDVEMNA